MIPADERGASAWWVIDRPGFAPTVHLADGPVTTPFSLTDQPGGGVFIEAWLGDRAPAGLRIVPLAGELETPLESRAWRGTPIDFTLPVGTFRVLVEGRDFSGEPEVWAERAILLQQYRANSLTRFDRRFGRRHNR